MDRRALLRLCHSAQKGEDKATQTDRHFITTCISSSKASIGGLRGHLDTNWESAHFCLLTWGLNWPFWESANFSWLILSLKGSDHWPFYVTRAGSWVTKKSNWYNTWGNEDTKWQRENLTIFRDTKRDKHTLNHNIYIMTSDNNIILDIIIIIIIIIMNTAQSGRWW